MTHSIRVLRFFAPIGALLLLGAGCFGGTQTAAGPDGGVYRTRDTGATWTQLKVLNSGTKIGSIADVGTVTVVMDPEDTNALYVGTVQNGMLVSLDGGESWTQARGLSTGKVTAIAVDPKQKCLVFAARANQINVTRNCGRDWGQAYFDPRTDKVFTAIAIDWFNPAIVYIGTSDGDILRSDDHGATWQAVERVDGVKINALAVDPHDSRIVYAATDGSGIDKTTDGGQHWEHIRKPFQELENARRVKTVALDPGTTGLIYSVSKYGLLRSSDGGATWEALKLPTPPGSVDIKSMVVNPLDGKELVYATDSSIVFSQDGGTTWTSRKLPTTRGAAALLFDTAKPQSLFLAVPAPKS